MQIPILFFMSIIFIIWLHYKYSLTTKKQSQIKDSFWEKEHRANAVRPHDISEIDYIRIPLDKLPMDCNNDPVLNNCIEDIMELYSKKIANFTGYTNTDLKLKYGTANINALIEYDKNYISLVRVLHKWSNQLYSLDFYPESISVLEFTTLTLKTEVHESYKLLAKLYLETNSSDKIDLLLEIIPQTKLSRQDSLIDHINSIKNNISSF